jgi:cephalosporin-C deacetylase
VPTIPYADQPSAPVLYDVPAEEFATYLPARDEPADFDLFWKTTLDEYRPQPLAPDVVRMDAGLSIVDTFDVTFAGYGGTPVRAWLVMPSRRTGPVPCVIQYVGYGGGRGLVIDHLIWAAAGYAHLVMDPRGQGGETPDPAVRSAGPAIVSGLHDPAEYYYRRLFVDAVCAVEAVRNLPDIDADRVAVSGASQGGGTALAVAAMGPPVSAVLCDVPFMCQWSRAVRISDRGPYTEVARHCAEHRQPVHDVFATLAYFDGLNFAVRCRAPALFSAALADRVCPPSTVYGAYNHYAGPKWMIAWEFNDHEGGGNHQVVQQLSFLRDLWHPSTIDLE